MSEKSSTFVTEFERKGTIKTTPNSLTCVRDYREFRCKCTTFFLNCANILTKKYIFMKYAHHRQLTHHIL